MRTTFGSPFQNTNSGIVQNDSQNEKRLQTGLQNWWNSTAEDQVYRSQFTNSVCPDKLKFATYAGPLFGLALGRFYTDAFCSPRYFYFRYMFMGLTTLCGYKYSTSLKDKHYVSFYTKNFHLFPKEIQDAIRSRDARYIRQYWQQE